MAINSNTDDSISPLGCVYQPLKESGGQLVFGVRVWGPRQPSGTTEAVEVEVTLRLTVGQSVSMSWHRAPLWNLRPDVTSCRNAV
jgi:hypothetical protein